MLPRSRTWKSLSRTQLPFQHQPHEPPPACLTLPPVSRASSAISRMLSIARDASLLLNALKYARRVTGRLTSCFVLRSPPSVLPNGRPRSIIAQCCLILTRTSQNSCGFAARGFLAVTRVQRPRNSLVKTLQNETCQSRTTADSSDLSETPLISHTVMTSWQMALDPAKALHPSLLLNLESTTIGEDLSSLTRRRGRVSIHPPAKTST